MRSFLRSSSLIAAVVGTVFIAIGGAVVYGQTGSIVAAKSDRLASVASFEPHYLTVETRFHDGSQLCRIPIEIGLWNTPQPGRCA
jgi:hypothetical protein